MSVAAGCHSAKEEGNRGNFRTRAQAKGHALAGHRGGGGGHVTRLAHSSGSQQRGAKDQRAVRTVDPLPSRCIQIRYLPQLCYTYQDLGFDVIDLWLWTL